MMGQWAYYYRQNMLIGAEICMHSQPKVVEEVGNTCTDKKICSATVWEHYMCN